MNDDFKFEGEERVSKSPYYEDPKLRKDAEFIRTLLPSYKPPRGFPIRIPKSFDFSMLIYIILVLVVGYLLLMDYSQPRKIVTVEKNVTNNEPQTTIEIMEGKNPDGGNMTYQDWWALSLETPCTGIENFFSGKGFLIDWIDMIEKYDAVYNTPGAEAVCMKEPGDILTNSTNFDCEDAAHATRCLADYYDVECSFWTKTYQGEIIPDTEGHLGVCCHVGNKWRCL
jgi:hypothetical protein